MTTFLQRGPSSSSKKWNEGGGATARGGNFNNEDHIEGDDYNVDVDEEEGQIDETILGRGGDSTKQLPQQQEQRQSYGDHNQNTIIRIGGGGEKREWNKSEPRWDNSNNRVADWEGKRDVRVGPGMTSATISSSISSRHIRDHNTSTLNTTTTTITTTTNTRGHNQDCSASKNYTTPPEPFHNHRGLHKQQQQVQEQNGNIGTRPASSGRNHHHHHETRTDRQSSSNNSMCMSDQSQPVRPSPRSESSWRNDQHHQRQGRAHNYHDDGGNHHHGHRYHQQQQQQQQKQQQQQFYRSGWDDRGPSSSSSRNTYQPVMENNTIRNNNNNNNDRHRRANQGNIVHHQNGGIDNHSNYNCRYYEKDSDNGNKNGNNNNYYSNNDRWGGGGHHHYHDHQRWDYDDTNHPRCEDRGGGNDDDVGTIDNGHPRRGDTNSNRYNGVDNNFCDDRRMGGRVIDDHSMMMSSLSDRGHDSQRGRRFEESSIHPVGRDDHWRGGGGGGGQGTNSFNYHHNRERPQGFVGGSWDPPIGGGSYDDIGTSQPLPRFGSRDSDRHHRQLSPHGGIADGNTSLPSSGARRPPFRSVERNRQPYQEDHPSRRQQQYGDSADRGRCSMNSTSSDSQHWNTNRHVPLSNMGGKIPPATVIPSYGGNNREGASVTGGGDPIGEIRNHQGRDNVNDNRNEFKGGDGGSVYDVDYSQSVREGSAERIKNDDDKSRRQIDVVIRGNTLHSPPQGGKDDELSMQDHSTDELAVASSTSSSNNLILSNREDPSGQNDVAPSSTTEWAPSNQGQQVPDASFGGDQPPAAKRVLAEGRGLHEDPPRKRQRDEQETKKAVAPLSAGPPQGGAPSQCVVMDAKAKSTYTTAITASIRSLPINSIGGEVADKGRLKDDRNKSNSDVPTKNSMSTNRNGLLANVDARKKEGPKMSTTLGIPLRWLKPVAKPKKLPPQKPVNQNEDQVPSPSLSKGTTLTMSKVPMAPVVGDKTEKKIPSTTISSTPLSPPHMSNRMVTDSSEGGSTASPRDVQTGGAVPVSNQILIEKVPAAIVTKTKTKTSQQKESKVRKADESPPNSTRHSESHIRCFLYPKDETGKIPREAVSCMDSISDARDGETRQTEWDSDATESSESSDSDTDDDADDVNQWGSMFNGPDSSLSSSIVDQTDAVDQKNKAVDGVAAPKLKIRLSAAKLQLLSNLQMPEAQKNKSSPLKLSLSGTKIGDEGEDGVEKDSEYIPERKAKKKKKRKNKMIPLSAIQPNIPEFDAEKARIDMEEERRKREEAKPLTAEQIKAILGDDEFSDAGGRHWVRRSVRQPSKALLNSKPVRMLIDKLKMNDRDMVVLKMKKYINDPNAPSAVLDAALNAMEENTNCEALYIQVRRLSLIFDVLDFVHQTYFNPFVGIVAPRYMYRISMKG